MIDQEEKTELLIEWLNEALPIRANIPLPLAKILAKKSPNTPVPAQCNVTSVCYTGDMGGILCGLDIGGPDTETAHLVSITHLTFHRHVPLSREIEAYQRHRTKKLRQQRRRGYRQPQVPAIGAKAARPNLGSRDLGPRPARH